MIFIKKLFKKAMVHSSLQVSLTYLRGLEVTELKEEEMPISSILSLFLQFGRAYHLDTKFF